MAAGQVAGCGIAAWAGLEEEAFTVEELLALAAEGAGGRHHLVAVQMPVRLVRMTPITQALHGHGPLPAAAGELPAWSTRTSPTQSGRDCPPPHRRASSPWCHAQD